MNNRSKRIVAFIFGGLIIAIPLTVRIRKNLRQFQIHLAKIEKDKRVSWIATGVIKERINRGAYFEKFPNNFEAAHAAAMEDFSFEQILINNDEIQP